MSEGRRRAVLVIRADLLLEMFADGGDYRWRVKDGLPADAKIIGAQYDLLRDAWDVVFESETLPAHPEGEAYRRFRPTVVVEAVA